MFSVSSLARDNSERSRPLPSPGQDVSRAEDPRRFHVTQPAWQSLTSREHICFVCFSGHGESTQYVTEVKVAPKTAYPLTPRTIFSGRKPVCWTQFALHRCAAAAAHLLGVVGFRRKTAVPLTPLQLLSSFSSWHRPSPRGPRAAAEQQQQQQQQGPRSPHPGGQHRNRFLYGV